MVVVIGDYWCDCDVCVYEYGVNVGWYCVVLFVGIIGRLCCLLRELLVRVVIFSFVLLVMILILFGMRLR